MLDALLDTLEEHDDQYTCTQPKYTGDIKTAQPNCPNRDSNVARSALTHNIKMILTTTWKPTV